MKKMLLSAALLAMIFAGCKKDEDKDSSTNPTGPATPQPAVAVVKENNSLTQKFSGTKCGPCGSWGWTMADELIAYAGDKAYYMGTFSNNFVAEGFIIAAATEMDGAMGAGPAGYPAFGVNGTLKLSRASGVNTTAEKTMCKDAIDAHRSATVVANSGVKATISGSTMTIKTSTKFFENATGDYYLALYVIEDGAMWKQSGHPLGASPIAHHHVMRAAVNGTWGEIMFTGDVKANAFKDKTVTYTLDPSWTAANLEVYAVIWKKTGSTYTFVNMQSSK